MVILWCRIVFFVSSLFPNFMDLHRNLTEKISFLMQKIAYFFFLAVTLFVGKDFVTCKLYFPIWLDSDCTCDSEINCIFVFLQRFIGRKQSWAQDFFFGTKILTLNQTKKGIILYTMLAKRRDTWLEGS